MIKNTGTTALLLAVMVSFSARADTVLFVGKKPDHPFGTHMYLHTLEMLSSCVENNADVKTMVSDGWPSDPEALKDVTTIVVYTTPAAEFLLDRPHRQQVTEMLDRGVGLVTIHWATSIFQKNMPRLGEVWLKYTGGTWISNVGLHTGESNLAQLVPDHPISRGWKEYTIHDEYYLNPSITEATPLLQVQAKGKPVTVGWSYQRADGGRYFGTTLGHFYRNFQREPFRKMVVNGILWAAKKPVPEAGAKTQVDAKLLDLPERPEPKK